MHAVLFTTSIEDVCDLYQFTYDYLLLVIIYLLFLFFLFITFLNAIKLMKLHLNCRRKQF